MKTHDARKHNQQTQFELRKQLVRLRKKGMTNKEAAEIVGISAAHGSTIWQKYQRGGIDAIKPGARGRQAGTKRTLSREQEQMLQQLMVDKNPRQLKLPFALWTRDALRLVIKKRLSIEMPLRTISDYLRRWGFTAQKPTKLAYEQDPKRVQEWLEKNEEKIKVFFLPPYSPELNPDEYLNGDLKQRIRSGIPAKTEKDLTKKTRSFMRMLQWRPKHVMNYFKHPKIAYAA